MKSVLILFLTILVLPAVSQDRLLTYTYQSNVLNKGQREIEVWNTFHWGKVDYYRALHHSIEFEIGLTKKLQTAFYFNVNSSTFFATELNYQGSTVIASSSLQKDHEFSFSNEWKYKMSDPVANAVGSALYAEVEFSGSEIELETKLILDKKIGRTMHVINLIAEPEFETEIENGKAEQEMEFSFEEDYGFMFNINKSWNVGLEVRNVNKTTSEDGLLYSTLFAGPGFSYVSGNFWINFTAMPQIAGLYHRKTYDFVDGLELNDNERLETRLIFSYMFQ